MLQGGLGRKLVMRLYVLVREISILNVETKIELEGFLAVLSQASQQVT